MLPTPAQVSALREAEQVFRSAPDVFSPDHLEGVFWHIIEPEEAATSDLFPEVLQGALIIAQSLEVGRRWRQRNSDKLYQNARRWALVNPEKMRESKRRWVLKNPEKNREKQRERCKRYYRRNLEKCREANRRYYHEHKGKK